MPQVDGEGGRGREGEGGRRRESEGEGGRGREREGRRDGTVSSRVRPVGWSTTIQICPVNVGS